MKKEPHFTRMEEFWKFQRVGGKCNLIKISFCGGVWILFGTTSSSSSSSSIAAAKTTATTTGDINMRKPSTCDPSNRMRNQKSDRSQDGMTKMQFLIIFTFNHLPSGTKKVEPAGKRLAVWWIVASTCPVST